MSGKRRALAERRRVVGYTQEQLAAVLGVERTTVVRWEARQTTVRSRGAGQSWPRPWTYRSKSWPPCSPKAGRSRTNDHGVVRSHGTIVNCAMWMRLRSRKTILSMIPCSPPRGL